jgi:hypothetical protein
MSNRSSTRPFLLAPPRLLLLGAMMGFAWLAYRHRFALFFQWSDTWVHLAFIRRTIEHGWFPGDAFYEAMPTPPYYSLEHVILAAASWSFGVAPHELWLLLPPLVGVMTMFACYLWLRALTGDARIAAIGASVELLVQAPDPTWTVMPYPRAVALAPLFSALFLYRRARQRSRLWFAVAAGLAAGLSLGIHLFVGGFCLLGLIFLEVASNGRGWKPHGLLFVALGIALVVASPWIVNVLNRWQERELLVPQLFDVAGEVWTYALAGVTLTSYQPRLVLSVLPWPLWPLLLLGLAASTLRYCRGGETTADRYGVWATAFTLVILLTPLYGVVASVLGVWAARMSQVIPTSLLIAQGVGQLATWAAHSSRFHPVARRVVAAAAVGALLYFTLAIVWYRSRTYASAEVFLSLGPFGRWDLEEVLKRNGVVPRVVLSDPLTSYMLPYYLGCHVVVIPAGHGSAYVDHGRRERAVARVFSNRTGMRDIHEILGHYRVDAVAISRHQPWPQAGRSEALLKRLRKNPAFQESGCCGEPALLRYLGPRAPGTTEHPDS